MKTITKVFTALIVLCLAVGVYAQKKDYSKEPGFVNFGDLSQLENDDSGTEVYLEDHLLKMVSKMSKKEDPAVAKLIEGLKLVRVNQFKVTSKNESRIENKISSLEKELANGKWERIVKTKSKGENANIYIKTSTDEKICGLVVVALQKGKEVTFVNIIGDIDLEAIGSLSGKFDIPGLDGINNKKKH